ncbi:MAG: radical SAM protein [Candidatus Omnitrophica bacterium]|nr:radical SAM protein [Candidatus Omnitrophota bacterium]MBU1523089.1 radical SAM protein [Candidatus Omnitrophota bacterium]MBU2437233.1 radical SAM protein [Candidatus Omnitrophota bacterium]
MKAIVIPSTYNYIGAFLTLGCNYRCSYCINYFENGKFNFKNSDGQDWVRGLNRIVSRDDLPVTLQGGEPSIHKDFIYIINNLKPELKIDILTNLQFDVEEFISKVDPQRLKRKAPYASIRVSFHPEVMDLGQTIEKVLKMQEAGFYIGIWGLLHPQYKDVILSAQGECVKLGIDFRTKEFLGSHSDKLYGTYKYKDACLMKEKRSVLCKTTEVLIAPDLKIYCCHSDLYAQRNSIGSLLDPNFQIKDEFRPCQYYGFCNPCDIKVKTNRFQNYGHSSVEIRL